MQTNNTNTTRKYGKSDPVGIVQDITIKPYWQMAYTQTSICPSQMLIIKKKKLVTLRILIFQRSTEWK